MVSIVVHGSLIDARVLCGCWVLLAVNQMLIIAVLVQSSVLSRGLLCLIDMDCIGDSFSHKSCSNMFTVCKCSIDSADMCSIGVANGLVRIGLPKYLSRVPSLGIPCCNLNPNC